MPWYWARRPRIPQPPAQAKVRRPPSAPRPPPRPRRILILAAPAPWPPRREALQPALRLVRPPRLLGRGRRQSAQQPPPLLLLWRSRQGNVSAQFASARSRLEIRSGRCPSARTSSTPSAWSAGPRSGASPHLVLFAGGRRWRGSPVREPRLSRPSPQATTVTQPQRPDVPAAAAADGAAAGRRGAAVGAAAAEAAVAGGPVPVAWLSCGPPWACRRVWHRQRLSARVVHRMWRPTYFWSTGSF